MEGGIRYQSSSELRVFHFDFQTFDSLSLNVSLQPLDFHCLTAFVSYHGVRIHRALGSVPAAVY